MTTSAEPVSCTRCHRRIRVKPVWWFGKPFGTTCAARCGLKAERRLRVAAPKRSNEIDQPVIEGLEDNEINDKDGE